MVTLKSSLSRWRTHRLIETYTEMESDSHLPHPRTWELLGVLAIFGPLPLLTYTPLYMLKDASEDLQSPFLTETSISSKSRLPLPSPPGEAAHSSTFHAAPSQETGCSQMLTSTSRHGAHRPSRRDSFLLQVIPSSYILFFSSWSLMLPISWWVPFLHWWFRDGGQADTILEYFTIYEATHPTIQSPNSWTSLSPMSFIFLLFNQP